MPELDIELARRALTRAQECYTDDATIVVEDAPAQVFIDESGQTWVKVWKKVPGVSKPTAMKPCPERLITLGVDETEEALNAAVTMLVDLRANYGWDELGYVGHEYDVWLERAKKLSGYVDVEDA